MIRIGAILAGGESRRMGGVDKATLLLRGARLVDRAFERLSPQVDVVVISGGNGYDLDDVTVVPDRPGGLRGPAAGVLSVNAWVRAHHPAAHGFFTVPVDGPCLPADLVERLGGPVSAIAEDDTGRHPTFAYWTCDALDAAARQIDRTQSASLKRLAEIVGARTVVWPGGASFININDRRDLEIRNRRGVSG